MPTIAVKLYSVFFKFLLKHRLNSLLLHHPPSPDPGGATTSSSSGAGITYRPDDPVFPSHPSFSSDGVATKDLHIDPVSSLSLRLFLPDPSLKSPKPLKPNASNPRRNSYDGYLPSTAAAAANVARKLPVVIQFHGGAFVAGSNNSSANDFFCRRIAKVLDAIVVAVGYRLAPESRYPAAFEDGVKVLHWLGKQANLAECGKSMVSSGGGESGREHMVDAFGAAAVEPWLAAHGDPSRCVLLGVSCGANIADFVARKAVEAGKLIEPVKVVAQVLMYPFFIGSVPTQSEIKLANSYFYDKSMCTLAWKLFLPEEEFSLDHPAANPLVPGRGPLLKWMPPTLIVVAEHDWMRDRAIAYSEELRKVNVDAPVLEYKDAVHEFATLDMLLKTPQAQACVEDIAIWVKKYISLRGHEFSY
ncbi:probable carboxylesterase 16 [Typha latifolia]|uniref:probable carboxylesterase 16 n=1 Tax=Typha latifolia TaxID=4733 RepID=UPI003C2F4D65